MEIDKELYKDIKEYCDLNGIKAKEYINTLLRKAFMQDKYGERPFQTVKDKETGRVITHNISDAVIEAKMKEFLQGMLKDVEDGNRKFEEFVEEVGQDKYNEVVTECIFGDDDAKNEDTSPQEPLPDKKPEEVSVKPKPQVKKRTIKPVK